MISYLKGIPVSVNKTIQNRWYLVLEVQDIGYEMQISNRLAQEFIELPSAAQIFTHLQIQEDKQILYGFASAAERDLFRQLTAVSGIGMQLGIALIDTLGISELVGAIVTSNIVTLCQTPGVGKKTAERIALELRSKLAQWRQMAGIDLQPQAESTTATPPDIQEDLEMTLLALGYTSQEIEDVIAALAQDPALLAQADVEEWIRRAIAWLSENVA